VRFNLHVITWHLVQLCVVFGRAPAPALTHSTTPAACGSTRPCNAGACDCGRPVQTQHKVIPPEETVAVGETVAVRIANNSALCVGTLACTLAEFAGNSMES